MDVGRWVVGHRGSSSADGDAEQRVLGEIGESFVLNRSSTFTQQIALGECGVGLLVASAKRIAQVEQRELQVAIR